MKTLKTLALIGASALAVSAVSTAAAQAQPYGYSNYGYGPARYATLPDNDRRRLSTGYVDRLQARVNDAARMRQISWNEARDLRNQLGYAHDLAYRVQTGRADRGDVRRLDSMLDRVESAVNRYAYNDRDHRYDHDWRR
jgi:hypothetical protein